MSNEPIGPIVAQGQPRWEAVVRFTLNALVAAEELGVTQASVDADRSSQSPDVQRLLGVTGDFGAKLGLGNDWAYKAIKAVGNYGDDLGAQHRHEDAAAARPRAQRAGRQRRPDDVDPRALMAAGAGRPRAVRDGRAVFRPRLSPEVLRERLPGILGQAALLAVVAWLAWSAADNFIGNVRALGVSAGFGFLRGEAGFEIAQSLIPFGPASSYGDAVIVATLNTLLVVALASVLGTLVGVCVAFGRLTRQPLIRGLASAYVEVFRNIPLLLQIFFWYFSAMALLPGRRRQPSAFGAVLLNNRGLFLPALQATSAGWAWVAPHVDGFNVAGGITLLPELMALTLGLAIYNGAFLAEIFRAGILSVPRGQAEAAATLGLGGVRAAWLVTLPQALRLALPPAAGQYQTLAKASALAAAIGYPDIMQIVGGTVLSQTSQALEAMLLVVLLYAAINLAIALAANLANRRLLRPRGRLT